MNDSDLKRIERRVYMSYFQDGLWDILLGIFLIGWGLTITFDFVAIMGGILVVFYSMVLGLKRWLTYPRAGYIKIAKARRQQIRIVILGVVLCGLGLMVFFLVSTGNRPEWFSEYFMFIFGVMITIVIFFLAYWWEVVRWYGYAVLVFVAFSVHQWLDTPLNLSFLIPGVFIVIYGFSLLYRFLRKYPEEAGGEINSGQ